MKNRKPDTAEFFGIDTSAQPGMTYKNEQKKLAEAKAYAEKLKVEEEKLLKPTEEVAKRKQISKPNNWYDFCNCVLLLGSVIEKSIA